MKKNILILGLLFLGAGISFQGKNSAALYSWQSGKISFFSEAPLENIEAYTESYAAVINPATRKFAFSVQISSFQFEKSLMQEHFNENYMESEKYPKGTFTGQINEDVNLLENGKHEVTVTGKLNIHGVEKERTIKANIEVKDKSLTLDSKFQVKLEDHDIEIPKLVIQNIAEVIDVTVSGKLKLKE